MSSATTHEAERTTGDSGEPSSGTGARTTQLRALAQLGPVVALIAMCIFFAFQASNFVSTGNFTIVLQQVSITAIAAVGATTVILVAGIDLSVGAVVALSGVAAALYLQHATLSAGASATVAIVVALVVGTLCGVINGLLVTVAKVPAFIATLATQIALRGLALLLTSSYPVSIRNTPFSHIGLSDVGPVPVPVIIMIVVFAIGYVILHRLKIGRRIYAVGGNAQAARLSGIRVDRTLLFVYVFAGFCTAISALILSSRLSSGQPAGSVGMELDVIAAVVVGGTSLFGGRGRLSGTFLGALLIATLSNGLTLMNVPDYWQRIITGIVIVVAVVMDRLSRGGGDQ